MYTRRRCGLCDEAREVVEAVARSIPLEFEEVFIDGDDDLELRYGIRIPVIEVAGREAFELSVDAEALAELVSGVDHG
jgi:Glutaredoxin-like domain (DUF836)